MSKAFNRVWHEGVIYKIKCMVVKCDLLSFIESFFSKDNKESLWIDKNLNGWQSKLVSLVHFLYIYIHINDLSDNLEPNEKLFADDTSMFLVVHHPLNTSQKLNSDLDKVSLWVNKSKMSFNPDPSKQPQEVIFSRKINKVYHAPLLFNNPTVQQISS